MQQELLEEKDYHGPGERGEGGVTEAFPMHVFSLCKRRNRRKRRTFFSCLGISPIEGLRRDMSCAPVFWLRLAGKSKKHTSPPRESAGGHAGTSPGRFCRIFCFKPFKP
jgi:hypothetical protein